MPLIEPALRIAGFGTSRPKCYRVLATESWKAVVS